MAAFRGQESPRSEDGLNGEKRTSHPGVDSPRRPLPAVRRSGSVPVPSRVCAWLPIGRKRLATYRANPPAPYPREPWLPIRRTLTATSSR
jgi:hypothetical protein